MPGQNREPPREPVTHTAPNPGITSTPPVLPDRWRVEDFLGAGGQAEVWRAFDRELHQLVAVRVFFPATTAPDRERMRRELRLGYALRHPCLVGVRELIDAGERFAVVMDWMPRGSVARLLDGARPLPIDQVLAIAERALEALEYLHAQGVLHRDVKPSNLLLDHEGRAYLSDLGLARPLQHGETVTETARVVGSAGYMSPEQLRGRDLTPASDLYSLGATLYHLLKGEPVFAADSGAELALAHIRERVPDPRASRADCPRWLARFVVRLLEKRPAERFPDGGVALLAFRGRHWAASARTWRVRTLAVVGTFAAAVGLVGALHAVGRAAERPASVVADGRSVKALGTDGRLLWQYDCGAPVAQLERADLDGDGEDETAVAAVPAPGVEERTGDAWVAEVLVLDRHGRLRDRLRPGEAIQRYDAHPTTPLLLVPRLVVADLDGDDHPDLVVNCRHRSLGSAYLIGYWGRLRRWEVLLSHPGGWIYHVASVPGATPPRLRFLAFNSLIGSHAVAAELVVGPPKSVPFPSGNSLVTGLGGTSLAWYTPLDQKIGMLPADEQPPFSVDSHGSSVFRLRGVPFSIDRLGNPSDSPNAGRDLCGLRIGFLAALGALWDGERNFLDAGMILGERERLRQQFAPLLRESAYRAVLDLQLCRLLARAGGLTEAVAILGERWRELHYDGLGLWMAHAQALLGDLDSAASTAATTMADATSSVGYFLAPRLLVRLAIERHDATLLSRAVSIFARGQPSELVASVEARANLWWDQPRDGDCRARSFDLVPDGAAIGCLARWRLGRGRPDDAELMRAALATSPDAAAECLTARAMALLTAGKAAEAISELQRAEALLAANGRNAWDFVWAQNYQLERACLVKALLTAGRRDEARRLAAELRPTLRPGLLPRILVEEVLRDLRTASVS